MDRGRHMHYVAIGAGNVYGCNSMLNGNAYSVALFQGSQAGLVSTVIVHADSGHQMAQTQQDSIG